NCPREAPDDWAIGWAGLRRYRIGTSRACWGGAGLAVCLFSRRALYPFCIARAEYSIVSARSYGSALLAITRAVGEDGFLPQAPIDLALAPGDFALVEVPSPLHGSSFANLCMGLTLLSNGNVRFLNRDWNVVPEVYAQAM